MERGRSRRWSNWFSSACLSRSAAAAQSVTAPAPPAAPAPAGSTSRSTARPARPTRCRCRTGTIRRRRLPNRPGRRDRRHARPHHLIGLGTEGNREELVPALGGPTMNHRVHRSTSGTSGSRCRSSPTPSAHHRTTSNNTLPRGRISARRAGRFRTEPSVISLRHLRRQSTEATQTLGHEESRSSPMRHFAANGVVKRHSHADDSSRQQQPRSLMRNGLSL
jgi:hypothetical protein